MTYHLHIKKSERLDHEQKGIPIQDWIDLLDEDRDFSTVVYDEDSVSAFLNTTGDSTEQLIWSGGHIDVELNKPNRLIVKKVISIANNLGAKMTTSLA